MKDILVANFLPILPRLTAFYLSIQAIRNNCFLGKKSVKLARSIIDYEFCPVSDTCVVPDTKWDL